MAVNFNTFLGGTQNVFIGGGAGDGGLSTLAQLLSRGGGQGALPQGAGNGGLGRSGFDLTNVHASASGLDITSVHVSFGDGVSSSPTGAGGLSADTQSNTVTTRGGYKIVAEGNTNWSVYKPDGSLLTKVNGDPHVTEGDGTKWDFSKDSEFTLPDGTQIFCDTSAQQGHSVTQNLTILDGSQRVNITGVDKSPVTSQVYSYGGGVFEDMQRMIQGHGFDHYQAHESGDQVSWTKGDEGTVTGSEFNGTEYVQHCEKQDDRGGAQALLQTLVAALFGGGSLAGSGGRGGVHIETAHVDIHRDQFGV